MGQKRQAAVRAHARLHEEEKLFRHAFLAVETNHLELFQTSAQPRIQTPPIQRGGSRQAPRTEKNSAFHRPRVVPRNARSQTLFFRTLSLQTQISGIERPKFKPRRKPCQQTPELSRLRKLLPPITRRNNTRSKKSSKKI